MKMKRNSRTFREKLSCFRFVQYYHFSSLALATFQHISPHYHCYITKILGARDIRLSDWLHIPLFQLVVFVFLLLISCTTNIYLNLLK